MLLITALFNAEDYEENDGKKFSKIDKKRETQRGTLYAFQ